MPRRFERQAVERAVARAALRADSNKPINRALIEITTSNSISVKADLEREFAGMRDPLRSEQKGEMTPKQDRPAAFTTGRSIWD